MWINDLLCVARSTLLTIRITSLRDEIFSGRADLGLKPKAIGKSASGTSLAIESR